MKYNYIRLNFLSIAVFIIAMLLSIASSAAPKKPALKPEPKASQKPFVFTISTDIESKNETIVIGVNVNSLADASYYSVKNNEVVEVNEGPYTVKYDLDCDGDGEYEHIGKTEFQTCVFQRNSGKHQIRIRGEIPAIRLCDMDNISDAQQTVDNTNAVVSVDDWGDVKWKSMENFASECKFLNAIPSKAPQLKDVKDVSGMFKNAESFNQPINHWNMSNVRDMFEMFCGAKSFNQPLDKWKVSKVVNLSNMFLEATAFNQPLNNWNVSNACYMDLMFLGASSYSHYPSKWTLPDTGWKPPEQYYIFGETKIEENEIKKPLKLRRRKNMCHFY